jgi:hypothetical protein
MMVKLAHWAVVVGILVVFSGLGAIGIELLDYSEHEMIGKPRSARLHLLPY